MLILLLYECSWIFSLNVFLVLCQDPTPDPDLGSEKELLFPLRSKERGAGLARVAVVQSPRSTAREKEREGGE